MTLRLLRPELSGNSYAREIDAALPRVLALADRDPLSPTLGYGDRQFWAWKLIDFPNGTFQGAVNGLSALLAADAFSSLVSKSDIVARIEEMLNATSRLMRRDGSFEEALPFEQSYCVTALVMYDALCAMMRMDEAIWTPSEAALSRLEKAIRFLIRRDETHGFISNHLATAAAALLRWDAICGDAAARRKAIDLHGRILDRQSDEGWFVEYGGADPGYQTLCMAHLADAAELTGDEKLWQALQKGADFLQYFIHPDGSFGGIYGSRRTRIYYPAGLELLAKRSEIARHLASRMRKSITNSATVTLTAIDPPNLLPIFNNYCQALLAAPDPDSPTDRAEHAGRRWFPQAGLLVDSGRTHYTVVSTRNSVVCHWRDGKSAICDTGIVLEDGTGYFLTSQADDPDNTLELLEDRIWISGKLRRRSIPLPGPWNFFLLRFLALTIMRIPPIGALVKRTIARLLVHSGGPPVGSFVREVTLGPKLSIADQWHPSSMKKVDLDRPFSVKHMASAGYWQVQDVENRTVAKPPDRQNHG